MKIRNLSFVLLLFAASAFGQDIKIENVEMTVNDGMVNLRVPEMKDNVTRLVEIVTPDGKNSYKKSVTNCKSESRTLLRNGDYIVRVTISEPGNKKYSEEQKFTVL